MEVDKFPVQQGQQNVIDEEIARIAYKHYAERYGNQQSFERIRERGGFSWYELVTFLYAEILELETEVDYLYREKAGADI